MSQQPTDLPPFDVDATCKKCASETISNEHHPAPVMQLGGTSTPCAEYFPGGIGEHVCRFCRDCGYSWCEDPIEPGTLAAG